MTSPRPESPEKGADFQLEEFEGPSSLNAQLASRYTAFEKSLSFWSCLRLYWRSSLYCLYGLLIVFNFGIDSIVAGYLVSIPKFREDYGVAFTGLDGNLAYVVPAKWLAIFSGASQLTAAIGALGTGYVADKIGRKYTLGLSCVVSIGGVAAQYWSNKSLGVLAGGKAINGIAIGSWLVIAPLYVSEVAPLPLRGVLAAMTNTTLLSGILLFTGVMYDIASKPAATSYLIPFACQWIIPGLVLLTFMLWPESPVWLVRRGRHEDAKKAIEKLHGTNSTIDKEGLLAQIEETIALERSHAVAQLKKSESYKECFNKLNRKRTFAVLFVYCCQYLSGNTLIIGYQTYFYQLLGYSPKYSFLLGLLHSAFMIVMNFVAWSFLVHFGRRTLYVWGQFAAAIVLFLIGACTVVGNAQAYTAIVGFVFIWGGIYQSCQATVGWTIGAELPALRLRATTQGLANVVLNVTLWIVSFVFPFLFNPDAANLGGKVGFVFGATTFFGFLGAFFWLPETKGRTPVELDRLYEMGISVRKFGSTQLDIQ
ncbi:general substrate transporter [Sarocladium strictum]